MFWWAGSQDSCFQSKNLFLMKRINYILKGWVKTPLRKMPPSCFYIVFLFCTSMSWWFLLFSGACKTLRLRQHALASFLKYARVVSGQHSCLFGYNVKTAFFTQPLCLFLRNHLKLCLFICLINIIAYLFFSILKTLETLEIQREA